MKDEVEAALDQCLEWMRSGMSVETCLARYPEYANELRPLLHMVTQVGRVLTPPASRVGRAEGHRRMLSALEERRHARNRLGPILFGLRQVLVALFRAPAGIGLGGRPIWQSVLLSLVLLIVTGSGLAVAAAGYSLPGEALYPMKLARQELQVALTFDPTTQASLEHRFEMQRREDVGRALAAANRGEVNFGGTLEDVQADRWNISGLTIQLDEETRVDADPVLGAQVRVRGRLPGDGSLRAIEIEVLGAGRDDPPEPQPQDTKVLPGETPERAETPTAKPTDPPTPEEIEEPESTAVVEQRPPTGTAEPADADDEVDDDSTQPHDTAQPGDDDDGDDHEDDDESKPDETDEPDDDTHGASPTPEPDETPDD